MNYKKEFKKEINNSIPKKSFKNISSKVAFNDKNNGGFIMKNKKLLLGLCSATACLVVVAGVGLGVGLSLNQTKKGTPTSLVKMSVNPELSMVLDENNKVISISGDNDEGKMIITGEKIVGKDVDEAISYIIKIENETGYLVNGEFTSTPNNITIQISTDDENIKNSIKSAVDEAIITTCDKLNIKENVEYAKELAHSELVDLVIMCDPSLTVEEATKLSNEDLLRIIELYHLETAELYTVELENLYVQAKGYKVEFAETQFVTDTVKTLGSIYEQVIISTLNNYVVELQNYINDINNYRYKTFIKEGCDYQVKYDELKQDKEEVISLKNKAANIEDEAKRNAVISILTLKEQAYDTVLASLDALKDTYLITLDSYQTMIQSSIDSINNVIDYLPSQEEFENKLSEKSKELENHLNDVKAKAFNEFEKEYKEDILKAKEAAKTYKEELKQKVIEARK